VTGRKRHILVDTEGLLLHVLVDGADIQDRDGGQAAVDEARPRLPRVAHLWADGGYRGRFVTWVQAHIGWTVEIVRRPDDAAGFEVLPRRWVVERTFGWIGRCRRLSKDYEELTGVSEGFIYLAMIHLMLRRLAPTKAY
jgi:putative transposase